MLKKQIKQTVCVFVLIIFSIVFLTLLVNCSEGEKSAETQKISHIAWSHDIKEAKVQAQNQNKPMMIDFYAEWCPPCNKMKDSTFTDPVVIEKSKHFIPVKIDVDKQGELANRYKSNASKYGGIGIPNILFISPDSIELAHPVGYKNPEQFIMIMDSVLARYKQETP